MARCRDCQARHWPRHVPEGVFLGRAWLGCPYVGPVLWPPRVLAFEGGNPGQNMTEYDNCCPSSYEYDNTTLLKHEPMEFWHDPSASAVTMSGAKERG